MPQSLPELGDLPIVVPGLRVRNLEIALRYRHLRIELERHTESLDGVFDQPFLEIKYAEIVVRPGVGGIDTAGEGPKDVSLSFHRQSTRIASKMAFRDAESGSSRNCPVKVSSTS